MIQIENVKLRLGQPTTVPDGEWFAVATWSRAERDYIEDPKIGLFSRQPLSLPVGSRAIRYTVYDGYVTTRRGLGQ